MNTQSRRYIEVVAADLAAIRERLTPYEALSAGNNPTARTLAFEAEDVLRALIRFVSESPVNRKVIADGRLRGAKVGYADEPAASFSLQGYVVERLLVIAAGMLNRVLRLEAATLPGAEREGLYGVIHAFGAAVYDLSKALAETR